MSPRSGRALPAQLADPDQGLAQLRDPVRLVLADQPDAPGEGVAAAASHAGTDQGVEHLPFGQPEPGHHGNGERGEEPPLAPHRGPPGDPAAEPPLRLLGDTHALVTRRLPEALDSGDATHVVERPVQRTDDQYLVAVAVHLRW